MRLILLGPPGAGKGTQSRLLHTKYGIPAISTGEILRTAVKTGSDLGRRAKRFMDDGELVPDDLIIAIVEERLRAEDCRKGFLLDGFPRNVHQADELEGILERLGVSIDAAVDLQVPSEDLVRRLSKRRTCRDCGALFHEEFNAPKKPATCDHCSGELYQRSDDHEDTIQARLRVYERETSALRSYYGKKDLLFEIEGTRRADDVFRGILGSVAASSNGNTGS